MRRRTAIRAIAVAALAVTVAYLMWRTVATVELAVWWVSVPLLVLEFHAALGLALFTFSLWDVDRRPDARDVLATTDRIAVLIPTYNESLEILTPTIAAAVAMRVDHETWVLDDGDRPEVEQLALDLGARYLTRPEHTHAKAGNLNHALGVIEADFVAVLDADHVASPDFLVHTLGYFDDAGVALVQTPQEFYNTDSFEHQAGRDGEPDRFHEQALFYRVLQPGKNRWGGAFWCGTGAVVRVAALREVGGVATDTITEDIHTTIRLHRRGWRTVYHNEVLARGLAASDAATYQLQRHRWGTGAMQVLRSENPMLVSGLSIAQRLSYAATLLGWFDAWRSLGYLLLPIIVLLTGAVPIKADALTFTLFFGFTFLLQQLSLRVLSRGCHRPFLSIVFEFVRMTPNLLATLTLVTRRKVAFAVTPKGRTGDARRPAHEPRVLRYLALLSLFAAAWFALTLLGSTFTHYEVPWAAYASFGWLVLNVFLIVSAIGRVRDLRYAGERRASVRFETAFSGSFDGAVCQILDLSLTGARVAVRSISELDSHHLVVLVDGDEVALESVVRSQRVDSGGRTVLGLEFLPGQNLARAALALALFHTTVVPARAEVVTGTRPAVAPTAPEPAAA
ncbi:MAG TPA: cellulose synthase catalytic subunit [Candidatus Limnocylindrales bacterium]|nr:cellulose synthase catalytic subunit [Candidatus Limnocylindrales bacterium]